MKRFSEQQMLQYWKRRYGLAALPGIKRLTDSNGLDEKLVEAIRAWYADLLRNAPAPLLPCAEMADEALVRKLSENSAVIFFPERGVRMTSVKMQGWAGRLAVAVDPNSDEAFLQNFSDTQGTPREPVAVRGEGRITVYGLADGVASLESLTMVAAPADGYIELDESLLRHSELLLN